MHNQGKHWHQGAFWRRRRAEIRAFSYTNPQLSMVNLMLAPPGRLPLPRGIPPNTPKELSTGEQSDIVYITSPTYERQKTEQSRVPRTIGGWGGPLRKKF